MTLAYKGLAVFDYERSRENTWRDPRTQIILAPGGIRNWPSKAEEDMIKEEYKLIRMKQAAERLANKKAVEKTGEF